MATIDVQVHCYERNHPGRPWAAVLAGPPEVTAADMVKAMDEVGVDGGLLVSVWTMYRWDASYALAVRKAHPGRFAVIKPVDPNDPKVADTIADWAKTDGTVAIRIMMAPDVSTDAADRGINRVLAAAAKLELPKLLALAAHKNIVVKISGACTLSHQKFPYKDVWDPLCRIFDTFGLNRCMWGTDWTRATALLTYKEGVDSFRVTDRLSDSDRAILMGGTLQKVYGWAPSKA